MPRKVIHIQLIDMKRYIAEATRRAMAYPLVTLATYLRACLEPRGQKAL